MTNSRVEPSERLLNLVIALSSTRRRLTKEQIRATVVGYADAPNDAAFERMFERDKDELRRLGIPLVTETDAFFDDEVGYRIDRESYGFPPIDFTPAELAVLSVAADFWKNAALGEVAARGLTKLRALGVHLDAQHLAGFTPRAVAPQSSFAPLLDAIENRQTVSFSYRAASTGEETKRTVQPWRLVSRPGAWYLLALDTTRQEPRTFRLSRITSGIRKNGRPGAFDIPTAALPMMTETSPDEMMEADLAVAPDRANLLRERAEQPITPIEDGSCPAGFERVVVRFGDLDAAVRLVAQYGPDVIVRAPESLRDGVIRSLTAVASWGGQSDG